MQIIKDREITDNRWRHLQDDEPVCNAPVTVSLQRWFTIRDALIERGMPVGVRLRPDDDVAQLADDLDAVALVVLQFDTFNEGRGYSQARLLRERYRYRGEIRALGAHRDHLAFMERCGINAFEPPTHVAPESVLAAFAEISVRYQPVGDGDNNVLNLRRSARRPLDSGTAG